MLLGSGQPVVVAALDWCQCNNNSYDRWREGLAESAGTIPKRVTLATVHQHDAPICDLTDLGIFQICFTGCTGHTTAGKYNTGAPENRPVLADRLYLAMVEAWQRTSRERLKQVEFRAADLRLPARSTGKFTFEAMQATLANTNATRWQRIEAALGLSWRQQVDKGRDIDVPCLDLGQGAVLFTILPAECFVGYQLAAQQLRPDSFVMVAGFGDGAAGYVPTDQCWCDGYEDDYCWVPPMTENAILRAVRQAFGGH